MPSFGSHPAGGERARIAADFQRGALTCQRPSRRVADGVVRANDAAGGSSAPKTCAAWRVPPKKIKAASASASYSPGSNSAAKLGTSFSRSSRTYPPRKNPCRSCRSCRSCMRARSIRCSRGRRPARESARRTSGPHPWYPQPDRVRHRRSTEIGFSPISHHAPFLRTVNASPQSRDLLTTPWVGTSIRMVFVQTPAGFPRRTLR
jgi:hypothetical protein